MEKTKITCAQILKLLNDYKLWDGITFRPFNTFQFVAHGIGGRYAIIKGKDPMGEVQWYIFTQTGKLILKIDKNIVNDSSAAFIMYALADIDENGCKPNVTSFLDDDINISINNLEEICSEETKQALEDIRKIFGIIIPTDIKEKLAELKKKIPAVIEEHVISDDGVNRIANTNIIPFELKGVLDDLYDIIENLSKENEYLKSKIQYKAKREDINGRICEILRDPCGRDTSLYGPSRTEESIIKICEIIRDLIK